jgi:hypothetical protein
VFTVLLIGFLMTRYGVGRMGAGDWGAGRGGEHGD